MSTNHLNGDAGWDPRTEPDGIVQTNNGEELTEAAAIPLQQQQQAQQALLSNNFGSAPTLMWPGSGLMPQQQQSQQQAEPNATALNGTQMPDGTTNMAFPTFAMPAAWGVPAAMGGTAAYFSQGQGETAQIPQVQQMDQNAQLQLALQQQQLMWQQMMQLPMAAMMQNYGVQPAGAVDGVSPFSTAAAALTGIPSYCAPGATSVTTNPTPVGLELTGRAARPKKSKTKPKRPLSAYNLFFKDERARMLEEIPTPEKDVDVEPNDSGDATKESSRESSGTTTTDKETSTTDKEGQTSSSSGDKKQVPSKTSRKRKRKPHGKISFEKMAQVIGKRWKQVDPDRLSVYKEKAGVDLKRYKKEMEVYLLRQRQGLEESREQLESTVDEETKARYFASGGVTKKRES